MLLQSRWVATQVRPIFLTTALLLIASICLGGGTREGHLSDAVLQAISVPALMTALCNWRWPDRRSAAGFAIVYLIIAVPLVQLLPIPVDTWRQLGRRSELWQIYQLLGEEPNWLPLSVVPRLTSLAALSLLPPVTLFVSICQLSGAERQWLVLTLVAAALASAALGLLQLAQGPGSSLRFFTITNTTDAVGFFANRNHFAALCYSALPLAFAVLSHNDQDRRMASRQRTRVGADAFRISALAGITVVLVAAQIMARSRAGLALAFCALAGSVLIYRAVNSESSSHSARGARWSLVTATAIVVIFGIQLGTYRIADRLTADPLADSRIPFARNTWAAAKAYLPFGSGVGTFPLVYPQFTPASDEQLDVYANRAHNDVLESLLEAGWLSVGVIVIALGWFAVRSAAIWRTRASAASVALPRASSIVMGLLVGHSFVDYPLRTAAMMAVFACCGAFIAVSVDDSEASN